MVSVSPKSINSLFFFSRLRVTRPRLLQLPSKLKTPSPEELEVVKLNRSLGRALENNTALAEAVRSKDDLVKDLNSRIKQVILRDREPRAPKIWQPRFKNTTEKVIVVGGGWG